MAVSASSESKENLELIKLAQGGDRTALNKLLKSHHWLVQKVVRVFAGSAAKQGVGRGDLSTEIYLGLWRAIEKYDLTRECKLSSYAHWRLRRAAARCIENNGFGRRVPVMAQYHLRLIRNAQDAYFEQHGSEPDIAYLAAETGLTQVVVKNSLKNATVFVSLQDYIYSGGEQTGERIDTVVDESVNGMLEVEDRLDEVAMYGRVNAIMDAIDPREAFVLKARYLHDMTWKEISTTLAAENGSPVCPSRDKLNRLHSIGIDRIRRRCPQP